MRRKYKNEIFNFLINSSLGLENFEFEETTINELIATKISYRNSPFIFTIRTSSESFDLFDYKFVNFSPTYYDSQFFPPEGWASFNEVFQSFKEWISSHVNEYLEEMQMPDLWSEFNNGNKSLKFEEIDFEKREVFNIEEKKQIRMSINELKMLIQKHLNTSDEEQQLVENRLDYLIDTSNRQNKFEWKSIAISTIISVSIALSLDTKKGQLLFELFKRVFSSVPMLLQ